MARLIDADELLQDNTWEWFDDWGNYTLAGQAIADAPTVDAVEVVHGEWFEVKVDYIGIVYKCSTCGAEFMTDTAGDFDWNYCPHCGAKMDGGDE